MTDLTGRVLMAPDYWGLNDILLEESEAESENKLSRTIYRAENSAFTGN